ncbi:uncharacterized protein EMH_0014790 [Eimeria mitis]|uniref:Uncharacterized protein n=1 Tax=Eimeria mitis TaxID=44415 RepID=U6KEC8_9EIME|nr:uncharacterized protein EMH_0014790 [Eimeria mitis]CDJ36350.1 hypothetical protein, conserved [Eimeria mitis]
MRVLQKLPPWVRCTCCRHRREAGAEAAATAEQLPQQLQQQQQKQQLQQQQRAEEGRLGAFGGFPCSETHEGDSAAAEAAKRKTQGTPDPTQQQGLLGQGGGLSPFAVAVVTCPPPPYEQQQQQQQQQVEGHCTLLPPSPAAMQQLQLPSQQAPSQRNLLREEAGEMGSRGALESFSPTFATELLADIELDGDTGTPTAAAAAAVAASAAAGTNTLLQIDVPVQQHQNAAGT